MITVKKCCCPDETPTEPPCFTGDAGNPGGGEGIACGDVGCPTSLVAPSVTLDFGGIFRNSTNPDDFETFNSSITIPPLILECESNITTFRSGLFNPLGSTDWPNEVECNDQISADCFSLYYPDQGCACQSIAEAMVAAPPDIGGIGETPTTQKTLFSFDFTGYEQDNGSGTGLINLLDFRCVGKQVLNVRWTLEFITSQAQAESLWPLRIQGNYTSNGSNRFFDSSGCRFGLHRLTQTGTSRFAFAYSQYQSRSTCLLLGGNPPQGNQEWFCNDFQVGEDFRLDFWNVVPIFETQEQTNEFLCQCFTNSLTFGDGADNSCVDGVAGNVCVNTNEDVIGCFSYENMLTDTDEMLVGGPSEITLT